MKYHSIVYRLPRSYDQDHLAVSHDKNKMIWITIMTFNEFLIYLCQYLLNNDNCNEKNNKLN